MKSRSFLARFRYLMGERRKGQGDGGIALPLQPGGRKAMPRLTRIAMTALGNRSHAPRDIGR